MNHDALGQTFFMWKEGVNMRKEHTLSSKVEVLQQKFSVLEGIFGHIPDNVREKLGKMRQNSPGVGQCE